MLVLQVERRSIPQFGGMVNGRPDEPIFHPISFFHFVTFFIFLLSAHIGISWKELEMKTNKVSRVMSLVASGFEPGPTQLEIEK